jgi:glycosyltransferase involved in cell wall biosynthesis
VKDDINKISIVMAYYNRKVQTLSTLESFNRHYVGKYNFEVIIVDDCSSKENRLDDIINNYKFKIIYRYITFEEKGIRVNPCVAYNIGFKLATGNVVIIQNPECYHYTDIMSNINKLDLCSNYYTALVMSSPSFEHNKIIVDNSHSNIKDMINYLEHANRGHPYEHSKGWYNHPKYQLPEKHHLHFCSIISKQKLDILGGFDETYANNYWYDDDEFLFRIKKILTPCFMMNTFVIHLFHENGSANHTGEKFTKSIAINRKKYEILRHTKGFGKINWR